MRPTRAGHLGYWTEEAATDLGDRVILEVDRVEDSGGCDCQDLVTIFRMNGDDVLETVQWTRWTVVKTVKMK